MKIKICDQIVNDILSDIRQGVLKPKEKLPTNQELAEKYKTSGVTVRKSIAILVNKGYLTSVERVGTFVKEREKDLFLANFSVEGNVNEIITEVVNEDIHLTLRRIKKEKQEIKTLEIKSIYYSDALPVAYVIDALYLKGKYDGDKIFQKAEKSIQKITRIFNGYDMEKSLEMTMDIPKKYICRRLLVDEGMPILSFNISYETLNGQPVGEKTVYVAGENIELKGKAVYGEI